MRPPDIWYTHRCRPQRNSISGLRRTGGMLVRGYVAAFLPLPHKIISVTRCDHQTRPHFIHIVAHMAASIPKKTTKPMMIIAMFW